MKGVEELREEALAHVKRMIGEYDAQSSEKKYGLMKIVRKKIIKDKDWVVVRKIFSESLLVGFFNSYSKIIYLFD